MTEEQQIKVSDLSSLHDKGVERFYTKYWESGYVNKRYRRGQNWSSGEEQNHVTDPVTGQYLGLKAYSMPNTVAKFNGIEAQQMQSPFDIQILPRSVEYEIEAEVKNAIHKAIYDSEELEYKMTDWYRGGVAVKYDIMKRWYDYNENIEGDIKVGRIRFDQCIWDDNCREYDIARYALWAEEFGYSTKEELKNTYTDKAEDIEKLTENIQSRVQSDNPYVSWYLTENGQELIKWVKHEQRKFKRVWKVTYNDKHTEEKDKQEKIVEQPQEMWLADASQGIVYPIAQIDVMREWIECYTFTKDCETLLEYKKYDEKYLHYHLFCAYYHDGDIACIMDWAKHPQRFIDRTTSQFDKSLGLLIKNSYQVSWENIQETDKEQWQTVENKLLSGGAVIKTLGANGQKVIQAIGGDSRVPPDIFQAYQFAMKVLEEMFGGGEAFGLNDPANRTKGGIEAVQQAGFSMAYMWIFGLRRSYKSLSEGIDEQICNIYSQSVERIVDITDSDLDELVLQQFADRDMLMKGEVNPNRNYLKITPALKLKEAKTRIVITKGDYSPSLKNQKREMWQIINQTRIEGGEAPYPASMWVEDAFDIQPTIKTKMKQFEDEQAKKQEEMRKMELGKQVLDGNIAMMKETREGFNQIQTQENTGKQFEHQVEQDNKPQNNGQKK